MFSRMFVYIRVAPLTIPLLPLWGLLGRRAATDQDSAFDHRREQSKLSFGFGRRNCCLEMPRRG
jgi:hypothetical protein